MDKKQLIAAAKESNLSRKVFKILDSRPKEPRFGTLEIRRVGDDLEETFKVVTVTSELLPIFQKMEAAGAGKIIEEPNKPKKFQFFYKMEDVVAVALEKPLPAGTLREIKQDEVKKAPTPHVSTKPGSTTEALAILPSGREFPLAIFQDLDKEDALALSNMLLRRAR